MSIEKKDAKEKRSVLGKKRDKDSYEKTIYRIEIGSDGKEIILEEVTIKKKSELSSYLSKLKCPYALKNGKVIDLSNEKEQSLFFEDEYNVQIYEKDDNINLFEDYKLVYKEFIDSKEQTVTQKYPIPLTQLCIGFKFFFNMPEIYLPQFYRMKCNLHNGVMLFLTTSYYKIFHLFSKKKCGTSTYLMKQMHRNQDYKIYIDLRKLNEILSSSDNKINNLKKFIIYSLFYISGIIDTVANGYKNVEKYFYEVWSQIFKNISLKDKTSFIVSLLKAYIFLYQQYIINLLNEEPGKFLIIIIDHYENDFNLSYIYDEMKNNNKIKFLIKHSIGNRKKIDFLFNFIDDSNYKYVQLYSTDGIELEKDQILIGYYNVMPDLGEQNFEDIKLEILKLYKDDLIENFGLNNPIYYIKFLDYMKNRNQLRKDPKIFKEFIKLISAEIEFDFSQFYNNDLSEENYYISKYYNQYLISSNIYNSDENAEIIKRNIPLDYFSIEYLPGTKKIINIKPSSNLIKNIIIKKSKYCDSIIYQSKYYDTTNNKSEQGNILQRAIEEIIQIEPSILLNYLEKTLIFNVEYIIPSAKLSGSNVDDPVEKFFKVNFSSKDDNNYEKEIQSYMSTNEVDEMTKLEKLISKEKPENIILIEKNPRAKNYDLAIIKFLDNKLYVLILFQITVSRDIHKFSSVNSRLSKDIQYILAKIEYFLKGYHSKSVHLIYVLDKNENIILEYNNSNKEIINDDKNSEIQKDEDKNTNDEKKLNYKRQIPKELNDNVHLLFFGRKILKFFTEEGKMVKELVCKNGEIIFECSEVKHYFLNEYIRNAFEQIIKSFNIKIGKYYIDMYDYRDMKGNFLILTKINDNHLLFIININGKIMHTLETNKDTFNNITKYINNNEKISYFFEIINPEEIYDISIFAPIKLIQ